MTRPLEGEIWQDRREPYRGRRGRVAAVTYTHVTLDPWPGYCDCPAKQRRTTIDRKRFLAAWRKVSDDLDGSQP